MRRCYTQPHLDRFGKKRKRNYDGFSGTANRAGSETGAPLARGNESDGMNARPGGIHRLRALWRAKFFSPKDFVRRAVLIGLLYGVASVAGLKEFTSILNGTTGSVEMDWRLSAFLGIGYVILHLAFVLLVPILLLAAAGLAFWNRIRGTSEAVPASGFTSASSNFEPKDLKHAPGSLASALEPFLKQ
jgi:hypothetical protein